MLNRTQNTFKEKTSSRAHCKNLRDKTQVQHNQVTNKLAYSRYYRRFRSRSVVYAGEEGGGVRGVNYHYTTLDNLQVLST